MVRTCTAVSAFVAAAALGVGATGCAEVVDRGQNSVSGSIVNPCNGELVRLAREERLSYAIVGDGAGGYYVSSHAVVTASGQGALGESYVGFGEGDSTFHAKPPFPFMARFGSTVSIDGRGRAPEFSLTLSWLATMTANGEITADLYDFDAECRG